MPTRTRTARTKAATTAPVVAATAPASAEAPSGYAPDLRQWVWLPGALSLSRSGEERLRKWQTREGRRQLSWSASKRDSASGAYGAPKRFTCGNDPRFGQLADKAWELAVQNPDGLMVAIEAFETVPSREQRDEDPLLTFWRVTSIEVAPVVRREERPEAPDAWADMPAAPAPTKAPAKAAGAWNAPPADDDLDTEVPF